MALAEDTEYVAKLLDDHAGKAWRMGVATDNLAAAGVPPAMRVGDVDADGWVEWRVLPSTVRDTDVSEVEREFSVQLPPLFRAYLLARLHLFHDVMSRRYNQQVFIPEIPAGKPLRPFRELLAAWRPLVAAGFMPFAEWGDGWGPMCFDTIRRGADGDCPIVWMDHEILATIGEVACQRRESVLPVAQPLHASFRDFLIDVFGEA